jgi:exodeoxyribonuclease V alpha subunit
MPKITSAQSSMIVETLRGIVDRITYHNPENGWSVLRVLPFDRPGAQETVIVHQIKVFAGATMEFRGAWTVHPRYGRQFKATDAVERKPATAAALEKYLGSGLIKGVGPKTARKIVRHFGDNTLAVFEEHIEELTEVPGIAVRKLATIREAWQEHRAIREVMMFLQSHGISTLFAVRIYKQYGDEAIRLVNEDPYRLAQDIYGIGFFSADRIALSIGLATNSPQRIVAGIRHVLAASRESGHCYLTQTQIETEVQELLGLDLAAQIPSLLTRMEKEGLLRVRLLPSASGAFETCYYSKSLYYDELAVAERIKAMGAAAPEVDHGRIAAWIARTCRSKNIALSEEQAAAVAGIAGCRFAVLTGGPGCGKTTTTLILVRLFEAMDLEVLLAAPTGRAAQRMSEVIGREAKTIHRLLEWQGGTFNKNEASPLKTDVLIVDECSMLDISLTAALLKAVPEEVRLLFIGDADQLPSVGAGDVLRDLIAAKTVNCYRLTKIFRQAEESLIIRYAHQINSGDLPPVESPFKKPELWRNKADCLFLDAEEATREQLQFIARAKRHFDLKAARLENENAESPYAFRTGETLVPYESEFSIPKKFQHVDLEQLLASRTGTEELRAVLKKVHPWSALHYGLAAADVIRNLYLKWIPRYFGADCEIQVLSPMTRGSLGTASLNRLLQESANPMGAGKGQLTVGERIFREGDRVIHRRNNYELGVFNGDIGIIKAIDAEELTCTVAFFPDRREVAYRKEDIVELDLAYAITIHKSQGSEFEAVIIPVLSQHFKMLFRNLIYTGLTRARKLAVFVGTRKALAMAVKNRDTAQRQTALRQLLRGEVV